MKAYLPFFYFAFLLLSCNPPQHNFSLVAEVFPNPCTDIVSFRVVDGVILPDRGSFVLVDAKSGEDIVNLAVSNNEEIYTVDMRPFEPGQYYINFIENGNVESSDVFLKVD